MNKKRQKRFLQLDVKTAIIVGTASLALFLLVSAGGRYYQTEQLHQKDHTLPLVITNLHYCNGEKLDLIVPEGAAKAPLVIYVHGGGWRYGSKVGDTADFIKPLSQEGFAVASINYRLSWSAEFPAQIQDVFCAVRYLRAHAEQYSLDKENIGIIGVSAGGHLAALAATTADNPQFTKGAYQEQSSRLQAAAAINGIYDLTAPSLTETTNENTDLLLGDSGFTRSQVSPKTWLGPNTAPQLLIHSIKDSNVSPLQTFEYEAEAQKKGALVSTFAVDDADHNLTPYWRLETKPKRAEIFRAIESFFSKNLRQL